MLKYKRMSLFDAPPGSILMHGCNAQGVWGRGIAAQFKELFPKTYEYYKNRCKMYLGNFPLHGAVGKNFLFPEENGREVSCLITSAGFNPPDSEEKILLNTGLALNEFFEEYEIFDRYAPIYCNKFNSGLFGVPWEDTEKILTYFAEKYNLDITVCEL